VKLPAKVLLIISVTALVVGIFVTLSRVDLAPAWTVALPLGVSCFGLFLITLLLQKEVAKFDEEERIKIELANRSSVSEKIETSGQKLPNVEEAPSSKSQAYFQMR